MSHYTRSGRRMELKYSPDQERDERGRFVSGSGSADEAVTTASSIPKSGNPTTDDISSTASRMSLDALEKSRAVKAGEVHRAVAMRAHRDAEAMHLSAMHAQASIGNDAGAKAHQQAARQHAKAITLHGRHAH